ncbi:MAG: hypothetical protein MJ252_01055 [archaeon]|nr:hypothetical protein [archaeon]
MLKEKNESNEITKVELFSQDKILYSVENSPLEIEQIETNDCSIVKYDRYSKKLVFIYKEKLEIYNKSKTRLKKEFKVSLRSDSKFQITKIAISKDISNILVISDNAFGEKKFEVFDLNTGKKFSKIQKDLKYMLEMMFISENLFCIISPCLITFYYIDISKTTIKTMKKYEYERKLIQDLQFNYEFKILIVLKIDLTFDLYNLSDVKFFDYPPKTFKFNFTSKSCDFFLSSLNPTGLFSYFTKDNKKIEKAQGIILNNYRNPEYFNRRSQFYLETLYFKLYFIYFNLERGKIYILQMQNINEFIDEKNKNLLIIDYPKNYGCASLQFIDNMILVHNFKENLISIYDTEVKKNCGEGLLLCSCKTSFYDDTTIKKDKIRDNLFIKNGTKYFKIHFNAKNYCNYFPNVQYRNFAMINIIIRKKAQYFLLEILKQELVVYCVEPKKLKKILEIMEHIAIKIRDSMTFVEKYANQKSVLDIQPIKQKILEVQAYPEVGKKLNRRIITINQVVHGIFIPLSEQIYTSQEHILNVMKILYIAFYFFEVRKIQIPRIYGTAVVGILKKIKKVIDIKLFLQCYFKIMATTDVAEYLIKEGYIKDNFIKNYVIIILAYRRHYERAFEIIIKEDGLTAALDFIQPFMKIVNKDKIKDILLRNKKVLLKYRTQLCSYLAMPESNTLFNGK